MTIRSRHVIPITALMLFLLFIWCSWRHLGTAPVEDVISRNIHLDMHKMFLRQESSIRYQVIVAGSSLRKPIFMMETSGKNGLSARQACTVESAAKENPNMDVYVHMTSSSIDINDLVMDALLCIPNVKFKYLQLDTYFQDTPLEKWYADRKWEQSPYKVAHMSDALRILILWKYGGMYMDLDVIVLKAIEDLKNCVGMESSESVANGVMVFDKGHPFLSKCLEEFAKNYREGEWRYNGPDLFTRILKKVCGNINNLTQVSRDKCAGVTVMPMEAFYAIPWEHWKAFFQTRNASDVISLWNNSYLIHVWNKLSANTPVNIGSGQPYELAAKKHCPSVYAAINPYGSF